MSRKVKFRINTPTIALFLKEGRQVAAACDFRGGCGKECRITGLMHDDAPDPMRESS